MTDNLSNIILAFINALYLCILIACEIPNPVF